MNNIKNLRLKAGFTQECVAEAIGVAPACISQWEGGDTMPRAATLKKLAEALGCSIDELVGR